MVGWHHRLNGQVLVNSGSWWWTRRPGMLQSMGSQRVGHNWATELNWTELNLYVSMLLSPFVQPFPFLLCPQVCSLCLCLPFCSANRFISTIFLDSIVTMHMCACLLSHSVMSDSSDYSPPVSVHRIFFRQESCSGLPFPPPGDFPDQRIEPRSSASPALAGRFFTFETLERSLPSDRLA